MRVVGFFGYLNYDPCGVFLGIIHKAELEWQLIIVLYSGHMQGELKSSLNFMGYFGLLQLFKNHCCSSNWGDIRQKLVFTMFENV